LSTQHLIAQIAATDGPLVVPGVGTPLEATIAVHLGFETVYVSGYATAGWRAAKPDIGLTGIGEVLDCVTAIRDQHDVVVIVDADTGYGDVANVHDSVRRLERAGAGAIQLEDQTWPKRCGHLDGKTVEPADVMVRKIRAATQARRDETTAIIARTDARGPIGLQEALDRAQAYEQAGADVVFVDAPHTVEEIKAVRGVVSGALMLNMSESGLTPDLDATQLRDVGADLVIYPTGAMRMATRAIADYFVHLRENGSSVGGADGMTPLDEINAMLGMSRYRELDRLAQQPVGEEA
jgi:2-methylisocitrate lyase-like PEP mutase family enzyme